MLWETRSLARHERKSIFFFFFSFFIFLKACGHYGVEDFDVGKEVCPCGRVLAEMIRWGNLGMGGALLLFALAVLPHGEAVYTKVSGPFLAP